MDLREGDFADKWAAADAAGLHRGAYHFFTFCSPGRAQAENFIAAVTPGQRMLPPAVDVEFSGNCSAPPPVDAIRAELSEFPQRVRAVYGRAPVIYATRDAYSRIIAGNFPGHAIWARDILCQPKLDDGREWTIWQYADRGRVPGVESLVDLNVFRGGIDTLNACGDAGDCG